MYSPRLLWILSHTGTRSDSLRPTIQLLICINLTYPSIVIIACNSQVRRSSASLPTWLRTKGWKVLPAAQVKAVNFKEGSDQQNETRHEKVKKVKRSEVSYEQELWGAWLYDTNLLQESGILLEALFASLLGPIWRAFYLWHCIAQRTYTPFRSLQLSSGTTQYYWYSQMLQRFLAVQNSSIGDLVTN